MDLDPFDDIVWPLHGDPGHWRERQPGNATCGGEEVYSNECRGSGRPACSHLSREHPSNDAPLKPCAKGSVELSMLLDAGPLGDSSLDDSDTSLIDTSLSESLDDSLDQSLSPENSSSSLDEWMLRESSLSSTSQLPGEPGESGALPISMIRSRSRPQPVEASTAKRDEDAVSRSKGHTAGGAGAAGRKIRGRSLRPRVAGLALLASRCRSRIIGFALPVCLRLCTGGRAQSAKGGGACAVRGHIVGSASLRPRAAAFGLALTRSGYSVRYRTAFPFYSTWRRMDAAKEKRKRRSLEFIDQLGQTPRSCAPMYAQMPTDAHDTASLPF